MQERARDAATQIEQAVLTTILEFLVAVLEMYIQEIYTSVKLRGLYKGLCIALSDYKFDVTMIRMDSERLAQLIERLLEICSSTDYVNSRMSLGFNRSAEEARADVPTTVASQPVNVLPTKSSRPRRKAAADFRPAAKRVKND